MKIFNVEIVFVEDLLGTAPLDKGIYTSYIVSKKPKEDILDGNKTNQIEAENEDEIETIEEEKGITGFHTDDKGNPFLYDYMIKGFMKDACGMMRLVTDSKSKEIKSYKKKIDGLVFIFPRKIPIKLNGNIGTLERPLRAQTAQGERVALAKSYTAPAGSSISFKIKILAAISDALLREWFDYGEMRGLGQWRNGSYGRFSYKIKADGQMKKEGNQRKRKHG